MRRDNEPHNLHSFESSRSHTVTVKSCAAVSRVQRLRVCIGLIYLWTRCGLEIAAKIEPRAAPEAFFSS